ncbi:CCA tRNA nucleotidyltransferase [Alkalicaulis satelles]|uniref:CCA tRNA nucleotidyltransferase n=1 Tax=Alkalicaulis satelles TaxID=2609175 RepID=A0A5M6ZJ22_9PROT|nr:CCA tRNA nucleotidyltransferase [Alkalicaulis satelles]KAA5804812.1 CCA tRNA nucleotidyltransferase [Alkalicaulis satelles]
MSKARLDPRTHDWLQTGPASVVMEAISPGASDRARFVGGCVRDALRGEPVGDIDIATQLAPDAVTAALEAAGIKAVPTGIEHGTVTAVVNSQPVEITSLRRDVSTDGRRAVVAFTQDWAEDASRRDFTLNAVYARRDGSLFDPFDGAAAAQAGRVVFIGQAQARIEEDYLRILRFYRFSAWMAQGLDPIGRKACEALAPKLASLSAERVWKELKRLLSAPDPGAVIEAMHKGHVLDVVWPAALDFKLFLSIINSDRGKSRPPDALVRLAALAGQDGDIVATLCERMKASRAEHARLAAMTGPAPEKAGPVRARMSQSDLGRALYHLGAQAVSDRLRLDEARTGDDASPALAQAAQWRKPRFPVSGEDLIRAGLTPGPELGARLEALEERWVASGFTLTREDLLGREDPA